jgi:hypothetical protein
MGGVTAVARYLGGLLTVVVLCASASLADTTTERSSSILIFPKVVFDDSRDTLIQISNTSNSMAHAQCFYVNAVPFCTGTGDCTLDTCTGQCLPQWQEVDFQIWLTKQQPTSWAAGLGRLSFPSDDQCRSDFLHPERDEAECYGSGFDPGRIPPVSLPFQGELKCVEVDPSGAPISGNHIKGEATIVSRDGDTSKYNAIGIIGVDANNGDNTLCLGGDTSESCPSGAEYNACPEVLIVNHFADRADNPLLGPTSEVRTELTLVPCTENFETQVPSRVVVQFVMTNEFELAFSASTTVDCWGNFFLDDINPVFGVVPLGTRMVQTRARPATSAHSAIVGVIEEHHTLTDVTARAALNLHTEGQRAVADLIVLPEGP